MARRRLILALFSVAALSGVGLIYGPAFLGRTGPELALGSNSLPGALAGQVVRRKSGPLFDFDNPYLSGRSEWLRGQFEEELRRGSIPGAGPLETRFNAHVRRTPFTRGPWVAKLDAEETAYRLSTEGQVVESSIVFEVPEAPPDKVALFLVFSDFRKGIDGIGEFTKEIYLPPLPRALPGLNPVPKLESVQLLTREVRKPPELLARPTDIWILHEGMRTDSGLFVRYETWRNATGCEACATVRLNTGQYIVMPSKDGKGSRVAFLSYYSGQEIPPFFESLVEGMTSEFFRKFAEAVARLSPLWHASAEAEAWASNAWK